MLLRNRCISLNTATFKYSSGSNPTTQKSFKNNRRFTTIIPATTILNKIYFSVGCHNHSKQHYQDSHSSTKVLSSMRIKRTIATTSKNTNNKNDNKNKNKRWKIKLEESIIQSINIKDPLLQKYIRALGWINIRDISCNDDKTKGIITITLKLPSLLHPYKIKLEQDILNNAQTALNQFLKEDNDIADVHVDANDVIDSWIIKLDTSVLPILENNKNLNNDNAKDGKEKGKLVGINKINHILAVYSCKGGVGKSTIAVNLAYTLAKMGGRIGLLDCDIYGPSLPTLVNPADITIRPSPLGSNYIHPIMHDNVKLLSLGYVSQKSGVPGSGSNVTGGPTVLRGHMANKVINQLLYNTQWDELDILLLDLPPGTGDIPLSLLQQSNINLSGVVSITTPSKLSFIDTTKGITMFHNMNVPTLVCIENMSYIDYKNDRLYPFGKGLLHHLDNDNAQKDENDSVWMDIDKKRIFNIPLSIQLNDANEIGQPLCNTASTTEQKNNHEKKDTTNDESTIIKNIYNDIAKSISKDLFLLQHDIMPSNLPTSFSADQSVTIQGHEFDISNLVLICNNDTKSFIVRLFSADSGAAMEVTIHGNDLRITNPKTGALDDNTTMYDKTPTIEVTHYDSNNLVQSSATTNAPKKQKQDDKWKIFPVTIEKKGKLGYAIHWADGATIIYSMHSLAMLAKTMHSMK